MAREKSVTPYAIEYWKSFEYKRSDWPIKTRWPWVYVRLGLDILKPPKTAVLLPLADTRPVADGLKKVPSAVLLDSRVEPLVAGRNAVLLEFSAPAAADVVIRYFGDVLGQTVESQIAKHDYKLFVAEPHKLVPPGVPVPTKEAQIRVETYLFDDDPLVIYSKADAQRLPPDAAKQQPATLTHLPDMCRYRVTLVYETPDLANSALRALTR